MKSFAKIVRAGFVAFALVPFFAHAQWYGSVNQVGEPVSRSNSTYNSGDALRGGGSAVLGVVINARPIELDSGTARQISATVGGILGVVLGMHHSNSNAAPLIAGGVGTLVGYAAGGAISKTQAVELIVRTEDNRMIPVVQEVGDGNVFRAGQVVAIVQVNGRDRKSVV